MQPTYLPWIGYFDLIDRSDVFIFLDSVQFAKRSWQQRNRVKGPQNALWLTVPVLSKGRREQAIHEVEVDRASDFTERHLQTLLHLYARAPYYRKFEEGLSAILRRGHAWLADLNIDLILWLCSAFGIRTEMLRSRNLPVEGRRTELLVGICRHVAATRYISAEGSRGYIEQDNGFERDGIELVYHGYTHPTYRQQHGSFMPYLSAIDLLFNEGSGGLDVIRSGRSLVSAWKSAAR